MKNLKLDKTQIILLSNTFLILLILGFAIYYVIDIKGQITELESRIKSTPEKVVVDPPTVTPIPENPKVQCKAITQKGTRCKRLAKYPSEYCWQHGN